MVFVNMGSINGPADSVCRSAQLDMIESNTSTKRGVSWGEHVSPVASVSRSGNRYKADEAVGG